MEKFCSRFAFGEGDTKDPCGAVAHGDVATAILVSRNPQ